MVVTETMTELETERMAGLLELDAGLQQPIPGIRKILDAGLREPVGPPVHQLADITERKRLPLAVDDHRLFRGIVPPAILLADALGDVADIGQLLIEQERPIEKRQSNIR